MEKVQLKHPEGKKAVSMDADKYEVLKNSFVKCLKTRGTASFKELLDDVTVDLHRENIKVKGVIEWNLFWVTLDMEAQNEIKRDKSVSPHKYNFKVY